jgi:hypothetical protein
MSESSLTFSSTQSFRDKLMARNLAPYNVAGVYSPPVSQLTFEYTQSDLSVINSPDELIAENPFANKLYPLNEFGPEGGYNLDITYNGPLLPVDPNQGPYYPFSESPLVLSSEYYLNGSAFAPNNQNRFLPDGGYDFLYSTEDIPLSFKYFIQYWEPPSFVPSTYSPYQILLSNNPNGDNGPLSQDSYIAKLGAEQLKKLFEVRINAEIYQSTLGLVNLQALQDPFEASLVVSGREPLIYRNYRITVPENPILRTVDLATRLASAYWPVSPIPGDYFDENVPNGQSPQISNALNVANQLTGGFLGPILNITRNPSEIFLANTGNAQRSALFNNLDFNRYQPAYQEQFGGLLGIASGIVNAAVDLLGGNSVGPGYYVGSKNAEPSTITSPPNQVPVNAYGQQVNAPVYGPSELAILYEGNETQINFGLKAKGYADTGDITGAFVWTSPKYKGAAGYKPTVGGGIGSRDEEFNVVSANYTKGESTNIDFKKNSILDNTQRIVQSADNLQGIQKLKHVGNAINQVSKVFNDGYKEMTKGSQVVSYTDNTTGGEVGREYCRVFAKDTPYLTYADLQKRDGITKSGRRFTNSVMDSTYNLNIAPLRGSGDDRIGSTNLLKGADGKIVAKKYMFSIENLAWRTSSRPGFTYDELPDCEKGPNGGRVMWFPPYDIKFSESSTANWNPTSFIGRPEPIYTYKDTSRTGSLSWKIIVDSPSVINAIIEKQLKGQSKERVNSIIDSFFAGCVKYDIYELAKKFNTIPSKDLFTYQEIINNPRLTPEELEGVKREIPVEYTETTVTTEIDKVEKVNDDQSVASFNSKYLGFAFYFDNDVPGPKDKNVTTTSEDYQTSYNNYLGQKSTYSTTSSVTFAAGSPEANTDTFFTDIIENNFNVIETGFVRDALEILQNKKGTISITMVGSASAKASTQYNEALSKRRIDSIKKYFINKGFEQFLDDQTFKIASEQGAGETITIPQYSLAPITDSSSATTIDTGTQGSIDCTSDIVDKNNKVTSNSQTYSVSAMACRRVRISNINVTPLPLDPIIEEVPREVKTTQTRTSASTITEYPPQPQPTVDIVKKLKDGIGKKILRQLFSECDYFEVIKETNPFVYDSIQEKVKYFNPAFHSMTPEGLNSRLTFLNQCVRPGETIPVIGPDGTPKYNDAVNTSFGAPPVLILRIGDFFHTKIIPGSLQIGYEPLIFDLNPEGIGVQPMIANISLSFNVIGGQGIAKPVEQLQNALSFNYYGNTEVYDDRAVFTEDTSALDKTLVQGVLDGEQPATPAQVDNQQPNDGGSTIGTIITNIPVASGQTGEIGYKEIMDKLYDGTKDYFTTIVNQLEKVVLINNYGVLMMLNDRRENNPESTDLPTKNGSDDEKVLIYGNPSNYEGSVQSLFQLNYDGVNDEYNPIIAEFKLKHGSSYSGIILDNLKNNLSNYLKKFQPDFSNSISTIVQEITIYQQDFYQTVRKVSLVSQSLDGKLLSGNVPRVYNTSGTSEISSTSDPATSDTLVELKNDFERFIDVLPRFNTVVDGDYNIFTNNYFDGMYQTPFSSDEFTTTNEDWDKYFYIVICRILTDSAKLDAFQKDLNNGFEGDNQLVRRINRIVDDVASRYKKQIREEEKYMKDFKKVQDYKKFVDGLDGEMYVKGKLRKFNYNTTPNTDVQTNGEKIKDLYLNPFKFK